MHNQDKDWPSHFVGDGNDNYYYLQQKLINILFSAQITNNDRYSIAQQKMEFTLLVKKPQLETLNWQVDIDN